MPQFLNVKFSNSFQFRVSIRLNFTSSSSRWPNSVWSHLSVGTSFFLSTGWLAALTRGDYAHYICSSLLFTAGWLARSLEPFCHIEMRSLCKPVNVASFIVYISFRSLGLARSLLDLYNNGCDAFFLLLLQKKPSRATIIERGWKMMNCD